MTSVPKGNIAFYWFSRNCVKLGFMLITRTRVIGLENVPKKGGVILAPNHISHLDPPLVGITCMRKVHFLAKRELFSGFLGWYNNATGQIRVDRGRGSAAVDIAVEVLKEDGCLCIFPEGTRSKTGQMQQPHTGIVVIASRVDVPIIPILIEGTFEILPPRSSFPKLFKKIKITYGEPFHLTEEQRDLSSKEKMKETAESIMQRIRDLRTVS